MGEEAAPGVYPCNSPLWANTGCSQIPPFGGWASVCWSVKIGDDILRYSAEFLYRERINGLVRR
jgi:hypothetical protein